jgi:hypothetical protein
MTTNRVLERTRLSPSALRSSIFAVLIATASIALGQNESRWTANVGGGIGGGYTPLVGGISQKLNNGWHLRGGAGYKFTSHFSTTLQASYHGLGVSRAVLNEAKVPNGNAHLWSFTADPKIELRPYHGVDTYLIGAVGYYRRVVQFTRPTLQPVIIFDPFFGFFQGFIPADKVLGTIARGGIGGGAGAGFEFGVGPRGGNTKLFTEARYEYGATGAMPTRMVPVTLGIRW